MHYGTAAAIIETLRTRLATWMLDRGGLLALAVLGLYVWVAPAHIVDGDNAEFATLGATGGVAHPSGYPLYVLWLRLMQWLPGTTPAHTAALATVLLAAASVLVLHAACRAWGARPLGATIAVALVAAAPVFVRIGTEAEVFALNNLVVASVLWLAADAGPLRGVARAGALGLVAGLGLANHMTCALVAPVGVLGVVRGAREARAAVSIAATLAGLVVGLVPYAYLLVARDTPLSWGTVDGVDGLLGMILRRDYGGPGTFLPTGEHPTVTSHLVALAATIGRSFFYVGALGALAGLGIGIAKVREGEPRAGWIALAASWLLVGPLLVARFNLEPTGLGLYVCQRFHVLSLVVLALPLARIIPSVGGRAAVALASTVGLAAAVAPTLPHLSRVHTAAVEDYAANVLRVLPRDAIVFVGGDDEYLGLGYLQWATGVRQDVVIVAPQLTLHPWYMQRVTARGIVVPDGEGPGLVRAIRALLDAGRPVFVAKGELDVVAAFTTYPAGTLMRVLPAGTPTPPIDAVIHENEAIFAQFRFTYPRPGNDDEFATVVHRRYASTWTLLGRKAQQLGQPALAERAFAIGSELAPRP